MSDRPLAYIETRNFKNLQSQRIDWKNLNIFIGPNGSGKSNVISIFQFLKNCLTEPDQSRGVTSFEDAISLLGQTRILDGTIRELPSTVTLKYGFSDSSSKNVCKISVLEVSLLIQRNSTGGVYIKYESLSSHRTSISEKTTQIQKIRQRRSFSEPRYFYKFHDQVSGKGVYTRKENPTSNQTQFETLEKVPVNELMLQGIDLLLDKSQFAPNITPLYRERRKIIDDVKQWQFYNANHMDLEAIRNAEPKFGRKDVFLLSAGTNLAAVIFNLDQQDFDFIDRLNQEIKKILPATLKVRALVLGTNLNVEWRWQNLEEPFYLYDLSDGTVRMLCWAVILLSPSPPPLLVIEEPEIGLHTAWMSTLASWIKTASMKSQVIITTHSPSLLDQFTDCPENILVFHPMPKDQVHYSISRLDQSRLQSWFDDGWELGDLYRIGDPVIGGWPW